MNLARVVQDSDDDEELEISPPQGEPGTIKSTALNSDEITTDFSPTNPAQSAEVRTGSTEVLTRDIHDAHRALMEPTPDSNKASAAASHSTPRRSLTSPVPSKSKRRRTIIGNVGGINPTVREHERRKSANIPTSSAGNRTSDDDSINGYTSCAQKVRTGPSNCIDTMNLVQDIWEFPGSSVSYEPVLTSNDASSSKVKSRNASKGTIFGESNDASTENRSASMERRNSDSALLPLADVERTARLGGFEDRASFRMMARAGAEGAAAGTTRKRRIKRNKTYHSGMSGPGLSHDVLSSIPNQAELSTEPGTAGSPPEQSFYVDLSNPSITLDETQTDRYEQVSANTTQSELALTTSIIEPASVDPFAHCRGESSTLPEMTPLEQAHMDTAVSINPRLSPGRFLTPGNTMSSSPPVVTDDYLDVSKPSRKLKRSKSTNDTRQSREDTVAFSQEYTTQKTPLIGASRRQRRSKTVTSIPPQKQNLEVSGDELSLPVAEKSEMTEQTEPKTEDQVEGETVVSSIILKRKAESVDNNVDELGADQVATGLPKEQYKPRPSRSRGLRNVNDVVEAVDFSKRPKVRGKKRRKTTSALLDKVVEDPDDMPSKSRNIGKVNEDKDSKTSIVALEVINDHKAKEDTVRQSVADLADAEQLSVDEKRPDVETLDASDKTASNKNECQSVQQDESYPDEAEEGKDVEVVQKRTIGRKGQRKTIEDDNTIEPAAGTNHIPAQPENIEPKKPRGRPRKQLKIQAEVIQLSEEKVADEEGEPGVATADDEAILKEVMGNKAQDPPLEASTTSTHKLVEHMPSPEAANSPTKTPQRETKKGSDQHSPLSNAKIPLRVGLSKRVRIAPLLRMVRK
ncbi:MAG: hypothetical protein M1827_002529 [Pycnora praestabilis]|nr:MAG: hypothetical protein M1827_002529 [Pycnora praestabilis]